MNYLKILAFNMSSPRHVAPYNSIRGVFSYFKSFRSVNDRPQHLAIAVVEEEVCLGFSGNCVGAPRS